MIREQWEKDPEFAALPITVKKTVLRNYFDRAMVDDEFSVLPLSEQGRIRKNFLAKEGVVFDPEGEGNVDPLMDVIAEADAIPDIGSDISKFGRAAKNVFYASPGRGFGDLMEGMAAMAKKEPPRAETMPSRNKYLILDEIKKRGFDLPQYILDDPNLTNQAINEYLAQKSQYLKEKVAPFYEKVATAYPEPKLAYEGKGIGGFIEEAATGITRYAPSMVFGPGSFAPIFMQEKGRKYKEYKDSGYSEKQAQEASDLHAVLATPAEFLGNMLQLKAAGKVLGNIGKKLGMGEKMQAIIGALIKSGVGEGIEEYTQSYTEALADVYAFDPEASAEKIAQDVIKVWKSPEFQKSALTQMAMGATGGVMIPGAAIAISAPFDIATVLKKTKEQEFTGEQKKSFAEQVQKDVDDGKISIEDLDILSIRFPHVAKELNAIKENTIQKTKEEEAKKEEVVLKEEPKEAQSQKQEVSKSAEESAQIFEEKQAEEERTRQSIAGKEGLIEEPKPTATFQGFQLGTEPVYNIVGGEYDGSTVGEKRLKDLGIEIPETPEPPKPKPFIDRVQIKNKVKKDFSDTFENSEKEIEGFVNKRLMSAGISRDNVRAMSQEEKWARFGTESKKLGKTPDEMLSWMMEQRLQAVKKPEIKEIAKEPEITEEPTAEKTKEIPKLKTYDEYQNVIDDYETKLMDQGKSNKEIDEDPYLNKLYDARNAIGQKELEQSHSEEAKSPPQSTKAEKKVESPAPTPEVAETTPKREEAPTKPKIEQPGIQVSRNERQNGIEIKFDEKPDKEIIDRLKANGFIFSRRLKHWYSKYTDQKMSFANDLAGIEPKPIKPAFPGIPYSIDQLKSVDVKVEAISAGTGEKVFIKENAFNALNENKSKTDIYKELLECLS